MPPKTTAEPETGTPETGEQEPEQHEEESGGVTLGSLDARLDRLETAISRWIKGSSGQRKQATDQSADVAAQVRSEVEKIKTTEQKESKISELEQRVQKITERPPREYRKITKLLWGSDDDG